jgi:hypothetical protein
MADDESTSDPNEPRPEAAPPPPTEPLESLEPRRGFLRRHWGKTAIAAVILLPTLIFTIWAGIALSYSYSDGNRVGYVQKLSRKGWLCKTWEGELQISNIPGSAPILFQFTVRSDSVARAIEALAGRQVQIHYEQHVGVPSNCFGETEYFVTSVRDVSGSPP